VLQCLQRCLLYIRPAGAAAHETVSEDSTPFFDILVLQNVPADRLLCQRLFP